VDEKLSRKILDWAAFQYSNEVEWNETNEIMELLPRDMRRYETNEIMELLPRDMRRLQVE
jgi:hypothetical protein